MIKENNEIQDKVTKDEVKIRHMLNKLNDNMKNNMNSIYKEVKYENLEELNSDA